MVHRTSPAPDELISTSASVPHSLRTAQHDNRVIYRYQRSIQGIVGQYYTDEPSTIVTSALGQAADEYLHAHGYLPGTVRLIQNFFEVAMTKEDFVNMIAEQGVPVAEAVYLHSLIVRKNT